MLAREGVVPLAVTGAAALVVVQSAGAAWSIPLWVLLAGVFAFYRAPRRVAPALPLAVISPVSGRVSAVLRDHDPWLERDVLRLSIAVSFPWAGVIHTPIEGKITGFRASSGVYGEQREPRGGASPDCYALCVTTDEDDAVIYALSSAFAFSRFRADQAPGERVGQGARSGFMYFLTQADVLVPAVSVAEVAVGDRVEAGASVIATLVHA